MKKFIIPLGQSRYSPRKTTPAPNGVYDYGAVGESYRKRFGGPFYPVVQNKPPVPDCTYCGSRYTEGKGYLDCSGACSSF